MNRSLKINAALRTMLNLVNILIPLLAGPYLARVLDVNLYSGYNSALSVVSWFLPFATLGIYNYGIREVSRYRSDKARVDQLFTEFFMIGFCCTVLTALLYVLMINIFVTEEARPVYLILAVQIVSQAFFVEWMNEAEENYLFIFYKTAAVKVVHLCCVFLFVKQPGDTDIYALIVSLTMFFNYLLSYVHVRRNVRFVRAKLRDIAVLVKPLFIMLLLMNANMLYTYLDRLVLSISGNEPVQISYYQFSLSIIAVITQVINSIVIVTIPRLTTYMSMGKREKYNQLLYHSIHTFLMLGIPLCVGIAMMSGDMIYLYSGEKYMGASPTLILFAVRTIFWLLDRILAGQILFVHGMERRLTRLYLKYGGLNLALNILLVCAGRVTADAVIITTMAAECLLVAAQFRMAAKIENIKVLILDRYVRYYAIAALGMGLVIFSLQKYLLTDMVISFPYLRYICVTTVTAVIFYFACLVLFRDPIAMQGIHYAGLWKKKLWNRSDKGRNKNGDKNDK